MIPVGDLDYCSAVFSKSISFIFSNTLSKDAKVEKEHTLLSLTYERFLGVSDSVTIIRGKKDTLRIS